MRVSITSRLLATGCIVAAAVLAPRGAAANVIDETFLLFDRSLDYSGVGPVDWSQQGQAAPEAATSGSAATFRTINLNGVTEPGEPDFNNRMNKTVWGKLKLTQKRRVVIHTFGSAYDTALAVHTGNAVNKLKKVVFNDNFKVTGLSGTASLVRFDAKKGVQYAVQIGSKTGAEGDVYSTVSVFPPAGGLSAHLALVGGQAWYGRDYVCQRGPVPNPRCDAPAFLLHNSTDKTVKVTVATDLDPAFHPPAEVRLEAGQAKLATFTIDAGFDTATARTVAGHFTFTARRGTTVVSEARVRGLVLVKPGGSLPGVLQADVAPQAKAGFFNEPLPFVVKLTNTGGTPARGCHARTSYSGYVAAYTKVGWRRVNAAGKPIGAADVPLDIPAGKVRFVEVRIASMQSRVADLTLPIPVIPDVDIDCNNTQAVAFDHRNRFDLTARGGWRPAKLATAALGPKGDTLNVPKGGSAVFRVSVKNEGPAAPLIVWPSYVRPFDESEPAKQFAVTVCQAATASGPCLAPAASEVQYQAKKNATSFFRVIVKAPKANPGFDPALRRIFLVVSHRKPDAYVGTSRPAVAGRSIAPKRVSGG